MTSTNPNDFTPQKANESWALLCKAIDKIYEKQSSKLSYEELYRNVYYLVLHKYGEFAYNNLESSLEKNINKIYMRLNLVSNDENLLQTSVIVWQEAKFMIKAIRDIFLYLEKNYIQKKKLVPIIIKGYQIYKRVVFDQEGPVYKKIIAEILLRIKKEREGLKIDKISIKNFTAMLVELGLNYVNQDKRIGIKVSGGPEIEFYSKEIYKSLFEDPFLNETNVFYKQEAQLLIGNCTCSEYLINCFKRYKEEKDRVENYLDRESLKGLISVFFLNYIETYAKNLLEMESSGLVFLLNNEKFDDLKTLYFLFSCNSPSFDLLKIKINEYIMNFCQNEQEVHKIMKEKEKQAVPHSHLQLIENLITFRKKMLQIQDKSLSLKSMNEIEQKLDKSMQKNIKDAFVISLNKSNLITVALNLFIDYYFSNGCKNRKDQEIDIDLQDIFDLFKLLTNKDLFQIQYKQLLMKRLIDSISLNWEIENSLVFKFKTECGNYYTSKITTMFNDITISNQIMQEFKETHKEKLGEIDLEVHIVTKGKWPFKEDDFDTCQYPEELIRLQKIYESYYLKKNDGRIIGWLPKYGSVGIKGHFKERKKEFIVNTYMMCILMLFNRKGQFSFEEIKNLTKINNMADLKVNLKSLINFKLLLKGGKEDLIGEHDIFMVNEDFTHKNYKNKITLKKLMHDSMEKQEESINERLYIERKFVIEACIIRIMKARKKMEHGNLINEAMKLCENQYFSPSVALIKGCIENLINKDYMERCSEVNWYSYVS